MVLSGAPHWDTVPIQGTEKVRIRARSEIAYIGAITICQNPNNGGADTLRQCYTQV